MNSENQFIPFISIRGTCMEWVKAMLFGMNEDIPKCTGKQRGYIYGMCKKMGYPEHDLPRHISLKSEPREMNIEEAGDAIERLQSEVLTMEEAYFERYGEKKRYGKKASASIF